MLSLRDKRRATQTAPRRAAPTALDKLAAYFRGRRPSRTAPVQKGGAR